MTAAVVAGLLGGIAGLITGAWILWLYHARPRVSVPQAAAPLPPVLVVVAVYDEAALIERKLENLAALRYPEDSLRVLIVDGGSTDGTLAIAERWIADRSHFAVLRTDHRNKTAQLNEALRSQSFGAWILVTDCDALLPVETLETLVASATSASDIGVAGVSVRPVNAHPLEALHWRGTDWLRDRESDRGSAGIVAAPCYLARRSLLEELPAGTIADDVHVACNAMLHGLRVAHAPVTVLELRSPATIAALLRHKFRKAHAYLREIVRFAPHAGTFAPAMRAVFLWRATLLTLVPLLATGAAALALLTVVQAGAIVAAAAAPLALLLLVRPVRLAAQTLLLAALLGVVSAAALIAYPFWRQGASFPKIALPVEYPGADPVL
jgi:cellulose synthase/poly-beta-1,6-N-acetylglucosamine synthase-like glycosyltransferase